MIPIGFYLPARSSIWELLPLGSSGGFVGCPMRLIMGGFCRQLTIFLILPLVVTNAILYLWLGEQDSWLPSKPTPLLLQELVSRSAVWTVSFFSLETEWIISPTYLCSRRYESALNTSKNFSFYGTVDSPYQEDTIFLKNLWTCCFLFFFCLWEVFIMTYLCAGSCCGCYYLYAV